MDTIQKRTVRAVGISGNVPPGTVIRDVSVTASGNDYFPSDPRVKSVTKTGIKFLPDGSVKRDVVDVEYYSDESQRKSDTPTVYKKDCAARNDPVSTPKLSDNKSQISGCDISGLIIGGNMVTSVSNQGLRRLHVGPEPIRVALNYCTGERRIMDGPDDLLPNEIKNAEYIGLTVDRVKAREGITN